MPQSVESYRSLVTERAGYQCEYCRYPETISSTVLEIDHIQPESKDGQTVPDNLALACRRCNRQKSNKTSGIPLDTGKRVRLFNPRLDQWEDHFQLNPATREIIGLSVIGQVTAIELGFNQARAVTVRQLLLEKELFF